ncbi:hypothetical protein D3C72_1516400 [compost metagenome]
MRGGGLLQVIADDAGLHAADALDRIDQLNRVQVLRMVDADGDVDRLAAHRSARAARHHGHAELAAQAHGGLQVFDRLWNDDAKRDLPIVRGFRCVDGARDRVEAHIRSGFGFQALAQSQQRIEVGGGTGLALGRRCHGVRWRHGRSMLGVLSPTLSGNHRDQYRDEGRRALTEFGGWISSEFCCGGRNSSSFDGMDEGLLAGPEKQNGRLAPAYMADRLHTLPLCSLSRLREREHPNGDSKSRWLRPVGTELSPAAPGKRT